MLSNTLNKTLCWVLGAGYAMKSVSAQNPPAATITQAPETAPLTGDLATQYKTLSGITENTLTTTVINGTSTILPIWYCAPTESAEACKNCPTHTASATASCSEGFNALLLLPPLALAGLWIPPPFWPSNSDDRGRESQHPQKDQNHRAGINQNQNHHDRG
ncbi:hypothetical protein PG991_013422 [Apiospora marii]|uniref:Uncharacterized protein n=1 Tax=Apiospora marii TaxID=335849 RepID=A0ABR1R6U7_9PEZI